MIAALEYWFKAANDGVISRENNLLVSRAGNKKTDNNTVVSLSPTLVIILGHAVSACVVNVNFDDFFALSRPTNTNTRGHKYKLFKPRCTDSIRQQFFVDRVINVWNALPSTANFASLNVLGIAFKRLISPVFLVCNIFICVIEYAPSDCFIERLGQLLVFLSDLAVLLF